MTEENKTKKNIIIGPATLVWVFISGLGKANYNNDGYEYTASAIVTKEQKLEIERSILEVAPVKSLDELDNVPIKPCDAEGEETKDGDHFLVQSKTKTTYADGKKKVIVIANRKGQKIVFGDKKIGNESVGCISCDVGYSFIAKKKNAHLFLQGVQLLKFVPYDGVMFDDREKEGDFDGFGEEEENQFGDFDKAQEKAPSKL